MYQLPDNSTNIIYNILLVIMHSPSSLLIGFEDAFDDLHDHKAVEETDCFACWLTFADSLQKKIAMMGNLKTSSELST